MSTRASNCVTGRYNLWGAAPTHQSERLLSATWVAEGHARAKGIDEACASKVRIPCLVACPTLHLCFVVFKAPGRVVVYDKALIAKGHRFSKADRGVVDGGSIAGEVGRNALQAVSHRHGVAPENGRFFGWYGYSTRGYSKRRSMWCAHARTGSAAQSHWSACHGTANCTSHPYHDLTRRGRWLARTR
jgi:hypothetical protein